MQHRGRGRECVQVGFVGGVQVWGGECSKGSP